MRRRAAPHHLERARLAFDRLWRGDEALMSREDAYRWLGTTLGHEGGLSKMTMAECALVLRAVEKTVRRTDPIRDALLEAGIG